MTKIGNYEVLCALKSGGMGDVLLGRRRGPGSFEQMVAIKTIRSELAGAETVRAHFLDEAAILAKVNHGAIAGVHDFGDNDGTLYMVMEYVAGISFRELADMRPPPTVIARAIAEACRGLHAAHELKDLNGHPMGVVHRDISPDNLIMGFDGHVKVIDFGIALIKNRQAPATEFGSLKGKPAYMSPEQIKSEAIDRRSDIFSLAVVLWELLTGQSMFEGESIYAIVYAVQNQEIALPSSVVGPLPLGLDAVVLNGLERDIERRIPSAAQFAEQLEEVVMNAGEESLEAWAAKHLAGQRDKHREWLAGVIGGIDGTTNPPAGRPIGQITAVGNDTEAAAAVAIAHTEIGVTGVTGAGTGATPASTNVGDFAKQPEALNDLITSRKKPTVAIAAAVLLVTGLGVGGYLVTRDRRNPGVVGVVSVDAAPVVPMPAPDARGASDALLPLPVLVDAPLAPIADAPPTPIDARRSTTVRKPDAAPPRPPPPKPDAPPTELAVKPAGFGFIVVTAEPFANVSLDGAGLGPTPIMPPRKVPAGPHTIVLTSPKDGSVLLTRAITLTDGQTIRIKSP